MDGYYAYYSAVFSINYDCIEHFNDYADRKTMDRARLRSVFLCSARLVLGPHELWTLIIDAAFQSSQNRVHLTTSQASSAHVGCQIAEIQYIVRCVRRHAIEPHHLIAKTNLVCMDILRLAIAVIVSMCRWPWMVMAESSERKRRWWSQSVCNVIGTLIRPRNMEKNAFDASNKCG